MLNTGPVVLQITDNKLSSKSICVWIPIQPILNTRNNDCTTILNLTNFPESFTNFVNL